LKTISKNLNSASNSTFFDTQVELSINVSW
jgi:hypothetical protein